MAALRVSSYRKLFEEDACRGNGGPSVQRAGRYGAPISPAAPGQCPCDKLDFAAIKNLNQEGLSRFVKDRTLIANLNDRLVRLIEVARWFEEENESLECQIVDLQEKLASEAAPSAVVAPDRNLDAVVERLRRQRDETLRDTEELQEELECLQNEYEKVAQRRTVIQRERQEVSEEVDAVTAQCLALREQAAIYEQQLANMEARHFAEAGAMLEPQDRPVAAAALQFGSPDMATILDVKELYCQLAQGLQFECGASSSAAGLLRGGKEQEVGGGAGSPVADLSKMEDVGEMKDLISKLEAQLSELQERGEELEEQAAMKEAAHSDQIAELERSLDDIRQEEGDLEVQMKEQCDGYQELLGQKMARELEIAAYRSLMEEEGARL